MISSIISRLVILLFGTLYPAYASYKAVRTKNVKEYVKWMMYWIVFALFTCVETFTDVFIGFWFPFYYEIKIVLVLWLLSPATKGSSFLYRKFVHPMLAKREPEIDEYIARAKEQGYTTILQLGSQGMSFATNVIMQTAIKKMPIAAMAGEYQHQQQQQQQQARHVTDGAGGENSDFAQEELMAFSDDSSVEEWMPSAAKAAAPKKASARPRRGRSATSTKGGGGIVNHLRKSYSLCDLSKEIDLRADLNRNSMGLPEESVDGVRELQSEMRTRSARQRAAAAGTAVAGSHMDLYFPEVDVNIRSHNSRESSSIPLSQIRSTDDISSGFASSETVYAGEVGGGEGLVRSGSLNTARVRRPREELGGLGRGRISKRGLTTEDSDEFDLEDADLDLPPSMTQLPISTYSTVPYSSPTDQIPFFVNTNMNQLNNQLAFFNLLQANQAFMNRFLAQDNRVDSMVFSRNSTGVIVDEIVSELGSTENLSKSIPEENRQTGISDCKYATKASENENNEKSDKTKNAKPEQKLSSEPQIVNSHNEQNSSPDQKTYENEQKFKPEQVTSNKTEQNLSSELQSDKNKQDISPKEQATTKLIEKSPPGQQIVHKTEETPNDESGGISSINNKLKSEEISLMNNELKSEEISSINNELKSHTRKGRYGKKVAPRPPSVYVSNEDQEIENEDFQDAESEVEGNEFLGKAPDLISELGGETKIDDTAMSYRNTESPEVNLLNNKSNIDKFIKQSDFPASSTGTEPVVKTKEKHSKLSKLLPKSSHSFLNFFSLKEPSSSDSKSLKGSSENIPNFTRNSPARDDSDGIVIPLTDDATYVNDNSEFFETYQDPVKEDGGMISKENNDYEIREMSQSPTNKRKNL